MRKALGRVSRVEKRARREKSSGRKIFQYSVEEKKEGRSEAWNDGASPLLSLLFFFARSQFCLLFLLLPAFSSLLHSLSPPPNYNGGKQDRRIRALGRGQHRQVRVEEWCKESEREKKRVESVAYVARKIKKGGGGRASFAQSAPCPRPPERAGASLRVPLHHSQVERVFSARLSAISDARNEGRRVLSSREIWFDGAGEKPGRESRRRPATTTTALAQLLKNAPPVVFPHSIPTQQLRPLHGQGQEGVLCGQEGKDLRASLF